MIAKCPHCQKELGLNAAQLAKVNDALAKLPEGKFLKLNCPHCHEPIEIKADGAAVQKPEQQSEAARPKAGAPAAPKPINPPPEPPSSPNLDWLSSGEFKEREVIEDVPMALILMQDGPGRAAVEEAFSRIGYKTVAAKSAEEAIEQMRFKKFTGVVLHSRFEGDSLAGSKFYKHMRSLNMAQRRYIFFVLTGPEFKTLYDLEALAYSANIVVNDKEISNIALILKKSIPEYEALFGPYIKTLKAHSKK